jgi:hypothetical protein
VVRWMERNGDGLTIHKWRVGPLGWSQRESPDG